MCISIEALVLFLSFLPQDRILIAEDRVIVNADIGRVVYEPTGDLWCAERPRSEEMLEVVFE
ncbi:hypothetical protein [Actibacterium pelagium]|uniref:Uncharacterized protein n=1 Tax=Actibacterium pelagium TaxID=2029103 RepID=A0A917AFL3_9RHOB|nr:hypothetical protein [Actibacterium pelagium]GGE47723.1 hypothetical protein GCM10011517_14430 [Actibacterium pelagium]